MNQGKIQVEMNNEDYFTSSHKEDPPLIARIMRIENKVKNESIGVIAVSNHNEALQVRLLNTTID